MGHEEFARSTCGTVSHCRQADALSLWQLVHFHAIIRLDGLDPADPSRVIAPHPVFTVQLLTEAIRAVVASAWFTTVAHPAKPKGWDICWGPQLDIRTVRMPDAGEITRNPAMEKLMYRPVEAAQALGMGHTAVFALIKSGRLRSIKLGGARFITAEALRAFVCELEDKAATRIETEVA